MRGAPMKKAQTPGYKTKLFDRLFPPQKITLPNGHTVSRPRSRMPLILVTMAAVIWASLLLTGCDFNIIIKRGYQLTFILEKMFSPDWSYFNKVVQPLVETIQMSLIGSFIGATLALPFSVIASTNINHNGIIVGIMRLICSIIRTLPTLIIAQLAALCFGLGSFAGTVAIIIFTFGVVSKMMYEAIETIDMGAFEAMQASGANKFQSFRVACIPQIMPTYLSYCLYSFEMNIRAASILGYVGAGGLGVLINEVIGWRRYDRLGMILLALFVVVLIIENTSEYLRKKLS